MAAVHELEARERAAHGEHAGLLEQLLQLLLGQHLLLAAAHRRGGALAAAARAAVRLGGGARHAVLHALQRLKLFHDRLRRLVILHIPHVVRGAACAGSTRVSTSARPGHSTRRTWAA